MILSANDVAEHNFIEKGIVMFVKVKFTKIIVIFVISRQS